MMDALTALLNQIASGNVRQTLPDTILSQLSINATLSISGGRRDVAYHRVLDATECKWRDLISKHVTARVVWSVVIGAGLGGPQGEPTDTYLFGVFHAWPLYEPKETTEDEIEALLQTLFYGVAALGRAGSLPATYTFDNLLKRSKTPSRLAALLQIVCDHNVPACVNVLAAQLDVNTAQLDRMLDKDDYCSAGAKCVDVNIVNGVVSSSIGTRNDMIDTLLTMGWILIGHELTTYQGGVLCGVFPAMVSGTNARLDRFVRLANRIANEIGITSGISVSQVSIKYTWLGMQSLLATEYGARIAAIRSMKLGLSVGSKWMEVMGTRMAYHGLTSIMLIALAVKRFPTAGWTNFFDLEQINYTVENTHIIKDKLGEYVPFIESVRALVPLPFTIVEYTNADDEHKIRYLLRTYQLIRPAKIYPDWLKQGSLVIDLIGKALYDPYMMYKNTQGQSREYADFAYFALLLLRDVAKQASLQNFSNIYQSAALRPQEVEKVVAEFGKIVRTLPGTLGLMELATAHDLTALVNAVTNPLNEQLCPSGEIRNAIETADQTLRAYLSAPPPAPADVPTDPPESNPTPNDQSSPPNPGPAVISLVDELEGVNLDGRSPVNIGLAGGRSTPVSGDENGADLPSND